MKKIKYLHRITALVILCGLLLCATGCGKKPTPTEPSEQMSGESTGSTELNPSEQVQPTQEETATTEETETWETTEATEATEDSEPTESTAPKCEHIPGSWNVSATSTCTTEGSRYKKCKLCKETVMTESIPKINHTPGSWKVVKEATCTEEGAQYQVCTQCDTKLVTISVAKTAHEEVTLLGHSATGSKNGLTDGKKCRDCGAITQPQYVIPAANYTGFGYVVNGDAPNTCTVIYLGFDNQSNGRTASEDADNNGSDEHTGEITVPGEIAGYTVTGIGDKGFADRAEITKITLPASVKEIGESAFSGCTALTNITFLGNTAQWNAVTKGSGWNTNTGSYAVNCSDGTVAKKS